MIHPGIVVASGSSAKAISAGGGAAICRRHTAKPSNGSSSVAPISASTTL